MVLILYMLAYLLVGALLLCLAEMVTKQPCAFNDTSRTEIYYAVSVFYPIVLVMLLVIGLFSIPTGLIRLADYVISKKEEEE